nr:hypothetical protein B0A51_15022 [Rachicladosporium sp. CCFEE 5018]
MSRLRSFSFPRLGGAKRNDDGMTNAESPYHFAPSHSRESSGASTASTPVTPTFSSRNHGHWSSTSSLGTTPDSPVNLSKSPLHDLVEDPDEREDEQLDEDVNESYELEDEPLCICDTPFCAHQTSRDSRTTVIISPTPEWSPGDDAAIASLPSFQRRRSGELSHESLVTRISRGWPSVSSRWRDHKPTTSLSNPHIHSAPPSRSSSVRLGSLRQSLSAQLDSRNNMTPPYTPIEPSLPEMDFSRRARGAPSPLEISMPVSEDPIDGRDLASTPLLPPTMENLMKDTHHEVQSPLQSPTVAESADSFRRHHTPILTPTFTSMPTPPLSSTPSIASFGQYSSGHIPRTCDIPPMNISDNGDVWASKLGHANFHITPAPYFPEHCSPCNCKRLLDDWEAARKDWMQQQAHLSEHYGPTSQIFRLATEKWTQIDAIWRANHELATAQAGVANTDSTVHQPLAETAPLTRLPSLNDPQQPAKFPKIEDADIVGPMVQYAKIQRRPSKRQGFLRLFTDPASLLGGKAFGIRR